MSDPVTDLLATSPAFHDCTERELAALDELLTSSQPVRLPANWAFIHEHTPADSAYVLLDAGVEVYRGRTSVALLDAGTLVGEGGLVLNSLRSATVATQHRASAIRIEYADLDHTLAVTPELHDRISSLARSRAA